MSSWFRNVPFCPRPLQFPPVCTIDISNSNNHTHHISLDPINTPKWQHDNYVIICSFDVVGSCTHYTYILVTVPQLTVGSKGRLPLGYTVLPCIILPSCNWRWPAPVYQILHAQREYPSWCSILSAHIWRCLENCMESNCHLDTSWSYCITAPTMLYSVISFLLSLT